MGVLNNINPNVQLDADVDAVADSIPDNFDSRTAWPGCDSIKEVRD